MSEFYAVGSKRRFRVDVLFEGVRLSDIPDGMEVWYSIVRSQGRESEDIHGPFSVSTRDGKIYLVNPNNVSLAAFPTTRVNYYRRVG